mgnify:CR=1 FL=1
METGYLAYNATGYMYEKYNAFEVGVGGGGGEYVPQVGFGWTNGVALYLLNHSISAVLVVSEDDDEQSDDAGLIIGLVLCFLVVMMLVVYLLRKHRRMGKESVVYYHNDAGQSEFYNVTPTTATTAVPIQTTKNILVAEVVVEGEGEGDYNSHRDTNSSGISLHPL